MIAELLNEAFANSHKQLKSFIHRITASKADTEDIVQDTYLKASEKLHAFRSESSIKTWLFTIAANLAKDNLRARQRWPENVNDICKNEALADPDYLKEMLHIQTSSPYGQFEIKEHIVFCLTCIGKTLPLEQQLCIYLKEVYEFKLIEIAEILLVSESMVKYYLHTGRAKMIDIFEGRCALINKNGTCHQCSELNGLFNPKQNIQEELIKINLYKESNNTNKDYLLDLRLKIMSSLEPFQSTGSDLQLHHFEYNRKIMEKKLD